MTPDELLEQFRSDVSDTAQPYLWSDEEIYRYMNSAYRQFVRQTGGIADFTTEDVCEVPFSAGDQVVDLHPSILRIMKASLASDGRKVSVKNITDMDDLTGEADYGQPQSIDLNTVGYMKYVVIGEQKNKARLVYIPDTAGTLKLNVYRLPLNNVVDSSSNLDEVEEDHHEYLSLWMQHRAYSKHDADAYDPRLAEKRQQEFMAYCSYVKNEWERYKHKTRTVTYGGL